MIILPQRKSLRLKDHDYTSEGAYFLTICTFERFCIFGEIKSGKMALNDAGNIVQQCWQDIERKYTCTTLDQYIIMPNHIHGIILINKNVGATHWVARNRMNGPLPGSIGTIIGQFKPKAAKRINALRNTPTTFVWQRNFYEHIIRNDKDLMRIQQYILNNPTNWEKDEYYH
jgi:REP element-mobilizing transposase RayT